MKAPMKFKTKIKKLQKALDQPLSKGDSCPLCKKSFWKCKHTQSDVHLRKGEDMIRLIVRDELEKLLSDEK